MNSKGQPQAPDPFKTAQAQAGVNKEAIQESAKVNAIDLNAPWGSTTYTRNTEGVPTGQNISLGPAEQQFYNTSNTIKNTLGTKAQGYLDYLPNTAFTGPDHGAGDAVSKALYERKLGLVQPQLDEADNALKVQLSERGIPIGSEIYKNEMNRLSRARGNTLASISQDATLAGGQEYDRQLANALTMRNQPFNEISAFLQGAPAMNTPSFASTPGYQIAPPDLQGLVTNDYNTRLNQYNQQNSSFLNGLFGLGSAGLSMLSDRRFKKDIQRVGTLDNGLPVYGFRYSFGGDLAYRIGLMADDVEAVIPEAVHTTRFGIKSVDYERAVGAIQ